ncbi:MAG TPA: excinuclease ABC subunit UvrC [Bacilli bacterium]|nr:excinuclease ABC subunit UvrC [Bacilli bacterium]
MIDKEKLNNLPKQPGCYIMKNKDKEIIYVGKAKNLFNRVKSYFIGSHDSKTTALVAQIDDFEYIITSSETEALVLEMNLIKKHLPYYNIRLTDDKRYPYICVTSEEHPRIFYTRELNKKAKYYGPYPNATAAREVVDILNKVYPLRKCYKLPKKECLYYHLGQCLAPCIKEITSADYENILLEVNTFLKGNSKDRIKNLEKKMKEASNNLNFEKAKEYRNMIRNLEVVVEKQKMELSINDTDVFGYVTNELYVSVQIFHIRDYKMVERTGFLLEIIDNPEETFINFVNQFYLIAGNPLPEEILLPRVDVLGLAEELRNISMIPQRGKKKELINLVTLNAQEKIDVLIRKEKREYEKSEGAMFELGKILEIDPLSVIEAFDNSNIQGSSSVSAMVSYKNGLPNKKEYRKYKVKTVLSADDFHTMEEVIHRRYSRLKKEKKAFPDLIIVDGGKPQVTAAKKALVNVKVNLPVLGLFKDENHKTSGLFFDGKEIIIDKNSGLFLFLTSLQDEVHRYAIAFHHLVHSKTTFASSLEKIKGIGEVKKKQILQILGNKDFLEELDKLPLTAVQKQEIIKLYGNE